MRLKLFPFTLKDKAKIWLNSLRPRSIGTWIDLQAKFFKKIFPTHRTNGLKKQISNFSTKENEKFYECWERYMEAINACLIRAQLVFLDFGPQMGVINKIYNLLHHVLG